MSADEKKPVGRPQKNIPDPIPDTFENVIKSLVKPSPPKKGKG